MTNIQRRQSYMHKERENTGPSRKDNYMNEHHSIYSILRGKVTNKNRCELRSISTLQGL